MLGWSALYDQWKYWYCRLPVKKRELLPGPWVGSSVGVQVGVTEAGKGTAVFCFQPLDSVAM